MSASLWLGCAAMSSRFCLPGPCYHPPGRNAPVNKHCGHPDLVHATRRSAGRVYVRDGSKMTVKDRSEYERSAALDRAELDQILERRPDLRGKSLEGAKRILRREARLSLKPLRSST
jgi:hypothetical protein